MKRATDKVRSATPADAAEIVDIFRCGFSSERLALFIYGISGVERHVAEQLSWPQFSDTQYLVAPGPAGSRLLGAVEIRLQPLGLFLNYIAVRPEARQLKLGAALLASAIERWKSPSRKILALDVLEDNLEPRAWYRRLGFDPGLKTEWWTLPHQDSSREAAIISELPLAHACHAAFGFGRFRLSTEKSTYEVGLLGDRYFRLTDSHLLKDAAALATLAQMAPRRQLLALIPEGALPDALRPRAVRVAATERWTADLATLAERLR